MRTAALKAQSNAWVSTWTIRATSVFQRILRRSVQLIKDVYMTQNDMHETLALEASQRCSQPGPIAFLFHQKQLTFNILARLSDNRANQSKQL